MDGPALDGGDGGDDAVTATVAATPVDRLDAATAFETYVVPEIPVLLRVARSLTTSAADAEDLVQDTLLRAFRGIDRFDGAHPRAWLCTILRNTQVNRTRRRRPGLLADPDADPADPADTGPGPEALAESAEFQAAVMEALAGLPARFGRVVELVDVDGLSYAEAATVLDVPLGTVMSRLHRGRARIRRQIADRGLVPQVEGGAS
jgi:RNA polymerase sigma-70 factor (ECF subfamily)